MLAVRHWILSLMMVSLLGSTAAAEEQGEWSAIKGRLNDHARIIGVTEYNQLYQLLAQFEFAKNSHVVMLTVPSSGDKPVGEYAGQVWQAWGREDKSRTVLIMLSEAQKDGAIVVGEALKGKLHDKMSRDIVRENITPNMQGGNYSEAAMSSVLAVLGALVE